MHKKTRKHSALLLLMAPVIAIGSSALVAGTAGATGATAKKVASPTINICESVPGAFRFAINANVVSLRASCGSFKAKVGVNLVSEVSAPALYRSLSSISVNPAAAQLSRVFEDRHRQGEARRRQVGDGEVRQLEACRRGAEPACEPASEQPGACEPTA